VVEVKGKIETSLPLLGQKWMVAGFEMNRRLIYVASRIAIAILLLASVYCVMWIFSSASLACTACNCEYSLFAEHMRCRQPVIAEILTVVLIACAAMLWRAVRPPRKI
jgi:predicted signal transduction protein with EAL and GGDEF domain